MQLPLDASTRLALVSLVEAAKTAGLPHPSDQAMLDLAGTGDGLVVLDAEPPTAFAVVSRQGGDWVVELSTTAPGLLERALAEVVRHGGGTVRLWRHDAGHAAPAPPGFQLERELLQLRVPLPLPHPPPAAAIRPFRTGEDEPAWLAVNNRAFAGHPEQSGWTLADLARREDEPWFDPAGFLLHEATGRLAAFCWTKVHEVEEMGEIYVIAVDPDFQGRGLGRTMTGAGLAHLAGRGIATGMLYVDASNSAAVALYRSLGFVEHHADRAYLADL